MYFIIGSDEYTDPEESRQNDRQGRNSMRYGQRSAQPLPSTSQSMAGFKQTNIRPDFTIQGTTPDNNGDTRMNTKHYTVPLSHKNPPIEDTDEVFFQNNSVQHEQQKKGQQSVDPPYIYAATSSTSSDALVSQSSSHPSVPQEQSYMVMGKGHIGVRQNKPRSDWPDDKVSHESSTSVSLSLEESDSERRPASPRSGIDQFELGVSQTKVKQVYSDTDEDYGIQSTPSTPNNYYTKRPEQKEKNIPHHEYTFVNDAYTDDSTT